MSKAIDTIQRLHEEHAAERKLWARLVMAERKHHDHTLYLSGAERDDDMKGPRRDVVEAEQALRDLVDVDALLTEEP